MEEWQIPMSVLISNSGDDCSQDQTGMMNEPGIIRNTQMHVSLDPELHSSVPHVFLNGPSELIRSSILKPMLVMFTLPRHMGCSRPTSKTFKLSINTAKVGESIVAIRRYSTSIEVERRLVSILPKLG